MKVKLLKKLRNEAINNLDFVGGWTGCWTTKIEGIKYESEEVSSCKFVVFNDPENFVQNAIAHRVRIMKYGEEKEERIYKKKEDTVYLSTKYKKREYINKMIQDKIK